MRYLPLLRPRGSLVSSLTALSFYLYLLVCIVRMPVLVGGVAPWEAAVAVTGLLAFYASAMAAGPWGRDKRWRAFRSRFETHRAAIAGLGLLMILLGMAFLAPLLAPHDPVAPANTAAERYLAPTWDHPMGTDRMGRDLMSRVVYGARLSLFISGAAVAVAAILGLLIGTASGYVGGRVDEAVMRMIDGLLAFPRLLLVLCLVALFSNAPWVVVGLLGGTGWMGLARLVRSDVLALKQTDFVQAARASGAPGTRVVLRHLVPNVLGTVIVAATLRIGVIVLLESYLSFLGLGVQPPTPSWGVMVFEGRDVLVSAWWVSAFPGLAILSAVIACNLVGDGLRDAIEVRSA